MLEKRPYFREYVQLCQPDAPLARYMRGGHFPTRVANPLTPNSSALMYGSSIRMYVSSIYCAGVLGYHIESTDRQFG